MEAHHGMVRCGHCLQAFDTHPSFIPDQLDLQLELPILGKISAPQEFKVAVLQPMTLAEQVAIVHDEEAGDFQFQHRSWPWTIAAGVLLLLLLAQAAFWFRAGLAARMPGLKPALAVYCRILKCNVPLPREAGMISIESSDLVAEPAYENRIFLSALLRNHAPYAQAFPNLELTLTDNQDQPLARRMLTPAEYLPPAEGEATGLLPSHELGVKLHLDTSPFKPSGYKLVLLYPNG